MVDARLGPDGRYQGSDTSMGLMRPLRRALSRLYWWMRGEYHGQGEARYAFAFVEADNTSIFNLKPGRNYWIKDCRRPLVIKNCNRVMIIDPQDLINYPTVMLAEAYDQLARIEGYENHDVRQKEIIQEVRRFTQNLAR